MRLDVVAGRVPAVTAVGARTVKGVGKRMSRANVMINQTQVRELNEKRL